MKKRVAFISSVWLLFALLCLVLPDRVFSPSENRYLTQRPEFSVKAVVDGSYTKDLESWMTDQLVFRDALVQGRTVLAKLLGRTENQSVYFGKDDYLLESFQEIKRENWLKNLETARDFLNEMDSLNLDNYAGGHIMLVPTAAYVMPDRAPIHAPELDQEALFLEAQKYLPELIQVENVLQQHHTEEIYYRTDHHWTSLGAYYAYASLREQTGREVLPLDAYTQEILSDSFYGTSYARAGIYTIKPDSIKAMYLKDPELTVDYGDGTLENTLYDRSFLSKRDQYRVFLKGNYPVTVIRTGVKNGEKLLLIKDSYANTLVQFLTADYEEIHMIDLRYFYAPLTTYAMEQGITESLFVYQIKNFANEKMVLLP